LIPRPLTDERDDMLEQILTHTHIRRAKGWR